MKKTNTKQKSFSLLASNEIKITIKLIKKHMYIIKFWARNMQYLITKGFVNFLYLFTRIINFEKVKKEFFALKSQIIQVH